MKKFLPLLFLITHCALFAQSSDNGDGTFTNPVLWTDMPDPDVIQVADTFYFVSTSMHMLPGVTILKSTDLVNWAFAANVVPQFDDDPFFDLQGGNRYGKGQWATAIRHWGGQFHVLFTSNSNGTFIYSSPTMQGPWTKTTVFGAPYHPIFDRMLPLVEKDQGDSYNHHVLYDPGFLVDDDGRVYVVHGNTLNYITELDPVTCQPLGPARLLYKAHREGLEGNRPYHIGDYYYVICTYGGSHSGNVTCLRSRSLEGPWEEREVMCVGARMPESHILQACLIPLESGQTWAMAFLDMGVLGRIPHLVPVHWIDGWPVFGDWANGNLTLPKPKVLNGSNGSKGSNGSNGSKGSNGTIVSQTLATSDDFSSPTLGLQWQFNHNPDPSAYSLTQRPGWLRLHARRANQPLPKNRANNPLVNNGLPVSLTSVEVSDEAPLLMARGTLTQRMFGPYSQATVRVDASHLRTGDRAGLAILNIPYATLTITRTRQGFVLQQTAGDNVQETVHADVNLTSDQTAGLWLRADTEGQSGLARFAYSLDGEAFTPFGEEFQMVYSGVYFVGNRFALFCYSRQAKGGYLDVDDFQVDIRPLFERSVRPGTVLEAEWTDALWRTEMRWSEAPDSHPANMDVAWTQDGGIIAFDRLQVEGPISHATFTLRNVDAKNAFVELHDGTTHEVLGSADIPAPADAYVDVSMTLLKPLVSGHRLELRIWGHDWDNPRMGEVLLDRLTLW